MAWGDNCMLTTARRRRKKLFYIYIPIFMFKEGNRKTLMRGDDSVYFNFPFQCVLKSGGYARIVYNANLFLGSEFDWHSLLLIF